MPLKHPLITENGNLLLISVFRSHTGFQEFSRRSGTDQRFGFFGSSNFSTDALTPKTRSFVS